MRRTVTLDPDVARMLRDEARRRRKSFEQVVNDAIRRGLSQRSAAPRPTPYRIPPHIAKLAPGIARSHLGALADGLEDEALVAKLAR